MGNREKIISEAAALFRTYGIRAVTMDMLANRMGISKRTIYEIFKDKDELLQGVLEWMVVMRQEMTSQVFRESENVIEAVFRIMDIMMEHYGKMSPAFRLDIRKLHIDLLKKLREADENPYFEENRIMLERGIKEGIFRHDIDIDLTNKCLLGMVRMTERKDESLQEFSSQEMIRDFYVNYLRGISTPKGLDLIDFYGKNNKQNNRQV
jgi:AcrR family transcriptional regulator